MKGKKHNQFVYKTLLYSSAAVCIAAKVAEFYTVLRFITCQKSRDPFEVCFKAD
jgi:hypothetical protein